ncbi:ABC transporter ATP-binding protein [Oceaniglobus trochenteri]|uniref:ABC transporter ATP-binding protein n=1 Tax=Oceaniglobus trochenteri TaxID=2763260 RepID=UPI001CFFA954|nr:oligopeptide/dipeptide ABC transporter ATP-binding protein [Oceaniglobus trochenteri]
MSRDLLVEIDGLNKHFPVRGGTVKAVQDVSFAIHRGETVGLVGESGSGKSTLGRLLLRLIEPTSGEITFDGQSVSGARARELRALRRRMQMIFQDPYASLNRYFTIERTLTEPLHLHGIGRNADERRRIAAEMLEKVGFGPEVLQRYPASFSGGQRQRIGICRALMLRPDLVVADEPVSALDVSVQAQVLNILGDLRAEMNLTMLFITHDLAVVRQIAHRVVVLYLGRVMEIGPVEAMFDCAAHPYTETLVAAAPSIDHVIRPAELVGEIPNPLSPPSGCPFRTRCAHAVSACASADMSLREIAPNRFTSCIRAAAPGAFGQAPGVQVPA